MNDLNNQDLVELSVEADVAASVAAVIAIFLCCSWSCYWWWCRCWWWSSCKQASLLVLTFEFLLSHTLALSGVRSVWSLFIPVLLRVPLLQVRRWDQEPPANNIQYNHSKDRNNTWKLSINDNHTFINQYLLRHLHYVHAFQEDHPIQGHPEKWEMRSP